MDTNKPIKLHLGCGSKKRNGWVNIDINPDVKPDVVAHVSDLHMFKDNSVDTIDSCHLFEHLFPNEAKKALREWNRVLKPGGTLFIEMPNLQRCIEILSTSNDRHEREIAMIGLYGFDKRVIFPNGEDKDPIYFQVHKFGWTPNSIMYELKRHGFRNISFVEPTQKWRKAYNYKRDMRVRAVKAYNFK